MTPYTLQLQRSLWDNVNSAPSLLQERVTQNLMDLGAEPGALGQSGRLRVSHAGLELRHFQEPKRGVLSTEDSPHLWVVGVGVGPGRRGAVLLSALDTYVVTLRRRF